MARLRRRELERALEAAVRPPHPNVDLEQVRTPPHVAADLVWEAHQWGDLDGKRVLDLGCGTGIFCLGASLCGASVHGVDIDDASIQAAKDLLGDRATFEVADVAAWTSQAADTVLMNPPFGAQKGNKHADRPFLQKAAACADVVWFLALEHTEAFLQHEAKRLGMRIEKVLRWDYPLEAQHAFHTAAVRTIPVGAYRLSR